MAKSVKELQERSEQIADELDQLVVDEKVEKELKKVFESNSDLKGMLNVFEVGEIVIMNPLTISELQAPKASNEVKKVISLCAEIEEVNGLLAAKQRPDFKAKSSE